MTKNRLKKLRSLIKEAEHLEQLLSAPPRSSQYVVDYAKDYRSGFPTPFTIAGYGQESYVKVRQRLYDKLRAIQSEVDELEKWLSSVGDPQIRDFLRLQYIKGLTHEQIAEEIGCARETVTRKLKKFWGNCK